MYNVHVQCTRIDLAELDEKTTTKYSPADAWNGTAGQILWIHLVEWRISVAQFSLRFAINFRWFSQGIFSIPKNIHLHPSTYGFRMTHSSSSNDNVYSFLQWQCLKFNVHTLWSEFNFKLKNDIEWHSRAFGSLFLRYFHGKTVWKPEFPERKRIVNNLKMAIYSSDTQNPLQPM